MTQEEFDYKHEENYQWYKMWDRLFWIAVIPVFVTIVINQISAAIVFVVIQLFCLIFQSICRHRHNKLHQKWDDEQ